MSRVARGLALAVAVLVLIQPVLPVASAHGGSTSPGHHESSQTSAADARRLDPQAERLTPQNHYVHQRAPEGHGSVVVWEQKAFGRDWDIMAHNFSSGSGAFPVTSRHLDERNPDVRGPWIAWEEHHEHENASIDIVLFDIRTGHAIRVPDSGHDERFPAIAGDELFYVVETETGRRTIRAFDLTTQEVRAPVGNQTVVGKVGGYGPWMVWATGQPSSAKLHMLDTRSGNVTDIPKLWNLEDGPTIGHAGVAFIAQVGGAQAGTYAWLYNRSTGLTDLRTGVSPHDNVGTCQLGVLFDQPGTPTSDSNAITVWDTWIEKAISLGSDNFDPTCTSEHVVYVKRVQHPDEDIDQARWLYRFASEEIHLRRDARIDLDPDQRRAIYRNEARFSGTVVPGDPREPIQNVFVTVDNRPGREIPFERTEDGVRWNVTINVSSLSNGAHRLRVGVTDDLGVDTSRGFIFYVDRPFSMSGPSGDLDVPRTASSPFPFNILDHYQDYQPFYNTIFLAIVLIAAIAWGVLRYLRSRPPGTPEYVPPDEA